MLICVEKIEPNRHKTNPLYFSIYITFEKFCYNFYKYYTICLFTVHPHFVTRSYI
ncbi:hypothetical protein HanIR_Chr11g0516711 [Helianthus annuus]|nr:hypothetical protein HanIR_Chr11g0516711 [Helianthus annuus]